MHRKEKRPLGKTERAKTQPHNLPVCLVWLQEERMLLNNMHCILQVKVFCRHQLRKQQNLAPRMPRLWSQQSSTAKMLCSARLHVKAGTCFYVPWSAPSMATEQSRACTDLGRASGYGAGKSHVYIHCKKSKHCLCT